MANKNRSAIAVEVERIYECADSEALAVQRTHNYLVTRFDTGRYTPKAKATIEFLLQPYALQLVNACGSGIWEELERLGNKLEKLIVQEQEQTK